MSFAKLTKSEINTLSLVVAPVPNGKKAWYFIIVDSPKLNRFRRDVFSGPVNLEEYGIVIKRGYGEYPPQYVIDEMIRDYGYIPKAE